MNLFLVIALVILVLLIFPFGTLASLAAGGAMIWLSLATGLFAFTVSLISVAVGAASGNIRQGLIVAGVVLGGWAGLALTGVVLVWAGLNNVFA